MAVSIYILIITLNVTGLNAPIKDIDWLNGYKNKTHIYAVYKRPTSALKTESERMEKIYSMQMEIKRKLE